MFFYIGSSAYSYTHIYVYLYVYIYIYTYVYIYIYVYICIYVGVCVYAYVCISTARVNPVFFFSRQAASISLREVTPIACYTYIYVYIVAVML